MFSEQQDHKRREAKLRRVASREGLRIEKSRARNPDTPGWGGYCIIDHTSSPARSWTRPLLEPEGDFAPPVNFMVTDSRAEAARIQFVVGKPRLMR